MTVKEAAKNLNVSEQSVLNYINSGKLKASKKRKGLRFAFEITPESLAEFKEKYLTD